jgi:hypothetical protein
MAEDRAAYLLKFAQNATKRLPRLEDAERKPSAIKNINEITNLATKLSTVALDDSEELRLSYALRTIKVLLCREFTSLLTMTAKTSVLLKLEMDLLREYLGFLPFSQYLVTFRQC